MFRKLFVGNMTLFFVMGIVFWAAILKSGVHATVAGVILAALVPAEPLAGRQDFLSIGRNLLDRYRRAVRRDGTDEVQGLKPASEAEAPLERLERSLHPLSSFVVIPIFALANAGIEIGRGTFGGVFTESIGLGVFVGLVLGKPFGISFATLISTRLGLGELPAGVGMREVTGAAMLAGIGFTVSIFVTNLAYTDGARIDLAKAAIFLAFIASSLLGVTFLRITAARAAPKVDPASG
jgi:NhaA family Na+:H+ antiporter